jgi:K+ transporter
MKQTLLLIAIVVAFVIVVTWVESKHHLQKETLETEAKLLRLEIQQLHLQEASKEKHVQYLMSKYTEAKDSLAIERKNVRVQYVEYKKPIKVDLSTDAKRDSVIDTIIR